MLTTNVGAPFRAVFRAPLRLTLLSPTCASFYKIKRWKSYFYSQSPLRETDSARVSEGLLVYVLHNLLQATRSNGIAGYETTDNTGYNITITVIRYIIIDWEVVLLCNLGLRQHTYVRGRFFSVFNTLE